MLRSLHLPSLLACALVAGSPCAQIGQQFRFTLVTNGSGLDAVALTGGGPGGAVGDYDGDGWQDVSFCGSTDARPRILRNNGARVLAGFHEPWFVEVTDQVLPHDTVPSSLAMFVDLDRDGDQDLLVVRRYLDPATGDYDSKHTGLTYLENVGARFVKGNPPPGLGQVKKKNGGLALADWDLDGDLDIAFSHSAPAGLTSGSPGFWVRNDGLPNLVDVTATLGPDFSTPRRYFSVVLADFNMDGRPDLHAAVDLTADFHCHWTPPGQYVHVTNQVGTTNAGSDMGLALGDIENDGDLDIFSTNIDAGVLYVNDGAGNFTNEASARGVTPWPGFSIGWGTMFADFDLDGDQDLVFVGAQGPGQLFENDGNGQFQIVPGAGGMVLLGHGLITFDYDRDGDLDVLKWRSGSNRPSLYRNDSRRGGNHWLRIELRGTVSNSAGVGSRVRVDTGATSQYRAILAGQSFKSGPPLEAHFGLGTAAVADRITVTWPNGTVQTLDAVAADQELLITEP